MANVDTAQGIRHRVRIYSVGALGMSVAGVVGFFAVVGANAAHAVVAPIAAARTTPVRPVGGASHSTGTRSAASVTTAPVRPAAPRTTSVPAPRATPKATPRPTVTRSATATPTPTYIAPPPAPTHSS